MENKAILAEWGHLIQGFDSQMTELRLEMAGTGELIQSFQEGGQLFECVS